MLLLTATECGGICANILCARRYVQENHQAALDTTSPLYLFERQGDAGVSLPPAMLRQKSVFFVAVANHGGGGGVAEGRAQVKSIVVSMSDISSRSQFASNVVSKCFFACLA